MLDISSNPSNSVSLLSCRLRDSEGGLRDNFLGEPVSWGCLYLLLMDSLLRGGCGRCEEAGSGASKSKKKLLPHSYVHAFSAGVPEPNGGVSHSVP